MRLLALTLAAVLGTAPASWAGQPISTSLAECAEIFTWIADRASKRGNRTQAEIDRAREAAQGFRDAAEKEARTEGHRDPDAHIAGVQPSLTQKWSTRWADATLLSENLEWVKYCSALGKDRGVLPIKQD